MFTKTNIPVAQFVASIVTAITLTACGGDEAPVTTSSAGSTSDGGGSESTGSAGSAGSTGGTTAEDPTTGATSQGVDPCSKCSADALCEESGDCVCKDGFSGNGLECADIDECGKGLDNCSIDAACTNTPGGFTCACNPGYKGDGFDCKDVDECAQAGLNNCSAVATCTNTDGGFTCACNDGFSGDGVTCKGDKQFGEACGIPEECASGICLNDPNMCTISCTQMVAHDCRDQGKAGLCVATTDPNLFVCSGTFNGGPDKDDTVMVPGDASTRLFDSASDADLFLIKHGTKDIVFSAQPDPDDNLQLEVYSGGGAMLGTINDVGVGQAEAAQLNVGGTAGVIFVIVRNIGNSNGGYKISVENV